MPGVILLLIVALAAMVYASERAVEAGRRLARRVGVSDLVVGLTVTSIGTSLPELATTASAAFEAHGAGGPAAGVAAGNLIGSNMFLLGGLLGATALVRAFEIDPVALRRDAVALGVVTVAAILTAADGTVGRLEGVLLVVVFVVWLGFLAWGERARQERLASELAERESAAGAEGGWQPVAPVPLAAPPGSPTRDAIELVVGLAVVVGGAALVVDRGVVLAGSLGVQGAVIGLWVGVGTSLPEVVVSLQSARRGAADVAFGNVVGSAITNLALCLGTGALVSPLAVEASLLDAGFLVLVTASSLLLLADRRELSRPEGAVLLLSFLTYVVLRSAG